MHLIGQGLELLAVVDSKPSKVGSRQSSSRKRSELRALEDVECLKCCETPMVKSL